MIAESKVGQPEIRHRFLGIISGLFNAKVVDLDETAVSLLEELTDLTLRVTHTCVDAFGRETHRNHLICHVRQVQIVPFPLHARFVFRDQSAQESERVVAAALCLSPSIRFKHLFLLVLVHVISDHLLPLVDAVEVGDIHLGAEVNGLELLLRIDHE